jgi:hypothetical protein
MPQTNVRFVMIDILLGLCYPSTAQLLLWILGMSTEARQQDILLAALLGHRRSRLRGLYASASIRLIGTIALVATVFVGVAQAAPAYAVPSVAAKAGANCRVLRVVLHGTLPPTQTCLVKDLPAGQQVTPQITSVQCPAALRLWTDFNWSNNALCLEGTGWVNLSSYGLGFFGNWDNQVGSYDNRNSGWYGTFYSGSNRGGSTFGFNPNSSCAQLASSWNDNISSVQIDNWVNPTYITQTTKCSA